MVWRMYVVNENARQTGRTGCGNAALRAPSWRGTRIMIALSETCVSLLPSQHPL